MVKIAVIGYGYWGPNLARNFSEIEGAEVAAICDTNPRILEKARSRHPQAVCTTSSEDVLHDKRINAIIIATPPSTHVDLALRALRAGKHVLVEKPLALNSSDAEAVIAQAEPSGLVLAVDHTFVFMGAVIKVRDLIASGHLGDPYYYDSVRINLGLFQHDVNVAWDLAVHDLSILDFWIPQKPIAVSCTGSAHLTGRPTDVAYLTLLYRDNFIAHLHVNWLSPIKIRRTLVAGSRRMIVFDDLDVTEKIRIYDRGIANEEQVLSMQGKPLAYRRTGDILIPQFDMTEALRTEAEHFVRCITGGEKPIAGGQEALRVIRILEAAQESMQQGGTQVAVASP